MSFCTIAVLSSIANAGGDIAPVPVIEVPVAKSKDFYGGIGVSAMKLYNDGSEEEFTSTGVTLQLGYRYSEYISVEARYTQNVSKVVYDGGNSGNADNADYDTDFANTGIYLKPMYPVLEEFNIYALLGYGMVGLTAIPTGPNAADRAESGFQWGIGASYSATDTIDIFIDYTSLYSGEGFDHLATANDQQADLITFGISYRF